MSGNQINANSWSFKPTLKLSLFFIILFTILVYLGQWQLHRARYKKNISAIVQYKLQQPPVDFLKINNPTLPKDRFTIVNFNAKLLHKYTFLLDNQMHQHQAGYRILTVAEIIGCQTWLLIDRGWVASGHDRKILPIIEQINGIQNWSGIINSIPSGIVLQKDRLITGNNAPWVIQSLDYDLIRNLLGHDVFNFVVQLQNSNLTNYIIPQLSFGIAYEKHLVYASQWFFFAVLLLIYYLIATIKRKL